MIIHFFELNSHFNVLLLFSCWLRFGWLVFEQDSFHRVITRVGNLHTARNTHTHIILLMITTNFGIWAGIKISKGNLQWNMHSIQSFQIACQPRNQQAIGNGTVHFSMLAQDATKTNTRPSHTNRYLHFAKNFNIRVVHLRGV